MKKIVKLLIDNHRGYHEKALVFDLPLGENLLIYGENGSGKSSVFKALFGFFQSSINDKYKYVKNHDNLRRGFVEVTFQDYNDSKRMILSDTSQSYSFGSEHSTNNEEFIKTASYIKGFLDYTDLLKVYNNDSSNLFDVIVLHLLKDYVAIKHGATESFSQIWFKLKEDLLEKSYTRKDSLHIVSKQKLVNFEAQLRGALDDIFKTLNIFLETYFDNIGLDVWYSLDKIEVKYAKGKTNWKIYSNLKLVIQRAGRHLSNYKDDLNEAKLSAFSICLYLASLKNNPSIVSYKLIYLDDVFIGLDTGNRMPILRILEKEFSDYQIFISTHDRFWFESSKLLFQNHYVKWSYLELYENSKEIDNKVVSSPIISRGCSYLDQAYQHLHSVHKPDYPAAANYFRKELENIIAEYIPGWEFYDNELTFIPEFSLTRRLKHTFYFLNRNAIQLADVSDIDFFLQCLLHPLSHHNIYSPIYKGELIKIGKSIKEITNLLKDINERFAFSCFLEKGSSIKIEFALSKDEFVSYILCLKDNIILREKKDGSIEKKILPFKTSCIQILTKYKGKDTKYSPTKSDSAYHYDSISNCLSKLSTYLVTKLPDELHKLIFPIDIFDLVYVLQGETWIPFGKYKPMKA